MSLDKQPITTPFGVGINTKVDPKQLPIGKLLVLNNAIFGTDGLMTKRNGFGRLPDLSDESNTTLTTFNDSLTAIGTSLFNYSPETTTWYNKGTIAPVQLTVLPTVRSATNQSQEDTAVAPNGLACTVWTDSDGNSKYNVVDTASNQVIVQATNLPATATVARTFVLGRYFVITFLATVSAASHLQYIALPLLTPSSPTSATDLATNVAALTSGYDGVVANNSLYFAWSSTGPNIRFSFLDSTLVQHGVTTIASRTATKIALTADNTTATPTIWLLYWDTTNSNVYAASFSASGVAVLVSTVVVNSASIIMVACSASNGILNAFYQVTATYSYSLAVTDSISSKTVTSTGTVGSAVVVARSVALASKAFILNDITYLLVTYGSNDSNNQRFQPTYFLIDFSGNVLAKLAYANGGGYPSNQVLPQGNVSGSTVKIAYQLKDLITAVNKSQGVANTSGIYTQTGINLASFTISSLLSVPAEIAASLHLNGGFLWQYDGAKPVEHSFHLWPEDIGITGVSTAGGLIAQQYYYQVTYEWTDAQGMLHRSAPSIPMGFAITTAPGSFTANRTSGSATLASVSSFSGLQVGQPISGTGIPASTYILSMSVGSATITMSANATSGSATSTTITPTTLASLTINVPTLRLTYKTTNKVRIVIYRWSTAQQNYYQVTSVSSPTLNDTTVNSIAYTDSLSDAAILGNQLIYTTGGIVENIAAPACNDLSLYKTRLFLIDAEDENLLWYSKQVIEQTPVEMNDLFTLYLPPTIGAQGSTGKVKCIAPMDDKNVFFKPNAIYYNTGSGPDNTGANNDFSDPQFITANVGCSNPSSIVFQPMGLMFQSDKGIWLLNRSLETKYIGADVQTYTQDSLVLSALAVPGTTEVRFTMDSGVTLMYDYYYGQWGTFTGIPSISSTLYGGLHTFLNEFGQVYQETPGSYLDGSNPVLLSFKTGWVSLAGIQGFERFYQLFLLGEYITPFKLSIQLAYDFNPAPLQNITVTPDAPSSSYGDEAGPYGSGSPYGGAGTQFKARVFPAKQKCETFQITCNEYYDPQYGISAGAGLTLSALTSLIGVKKGTRTQSAKRSFG